MIKIFHLKKNYSNLLYSLAVFTVVLLLTVSCDSSNKDDSITFFGGKIKNPRSEYVYLFKDNKILDSAGLNSHNKFSFRLNSLELGLYTFKHGPEYQYLYLEPKDSLLLYLNTWDFDESLVFSGKGSAKNNYLINLYLQQEKVEKRFKNKFKLNEADFSKAINVEIGKQEAAFIEFLENEESSEFFDNLIHTGINFPLYYLKEYYPFNHKNVLKLSKFPKISEEFYSYRKDINLNDNSLISFQPYTTYIKTYLYHMAYIEKEKDHDKGNIQLNFMEIVKEKIKIESFKNELLASGLWRSLTNADVSSDDFKKIQDLFFECCSDEDLKLEIKRSIQQKEQLKDGDSLPDIIALSMDGKEVDIKTISKNNNTVIYFWPKDLGNVEMLNKKLIHLNKEFPDIVFIGIERNRSNKDWLKFVKTNKLEKSNQFKLLKNSSNYAMFEGDMARTIIVNNKGNIENAYLFFNDKFLYYHLNDLIKH